MRICTKCGKKKYDFMKGTRKHWCTDCWQTYSVAWRQKNKRKLRDQQLQNRYGITIEQYEELLDVQGGVCAICKQLCASGKDLAVDHDHDTGVVRGLLCMNCNIGIGHLATQDRLMQALIYLENAEDRAETATALVLT